MDAVEPEVVGGVSGVEDVRSVRARWIGHRVHGEVEVGVDAGLSAAEVAKIRERLYSEARRVVPKLQRLVVEAVPGGWSSQQWHRRPKFPSDARPFGAPLGPGKLSKRRVRACGGRSWPR